MESWEKCDSVWWRSNQRLDDVTNPAERNKERRGRMVSMSDSQPEGRGF
jgi:hypothetical protein